MSTHATDHDSLSHWSVSVGASPGRLIVMDGYQRKFQKNTSTTAMMLQLDYTPLPADSSRFASDYGYPTFGFGLKLNCNDVTMHRSASDGWGMAEEVDYDSRLGNIATAYATFTRPVLVWPRHALPGQRRVELDYMLGTGIGYARHKYSKGNNIDNELIGSRFLIYFTAGTHATWHLSPTWALFGGVEFYHHSNGALNRPNKGANYWGPVVGIKGRLPHPHQEQKSPATARSKTAGTLLLAEETNPLFLSFSLGLGGKTLNEDWQLMQFRTPPDSARYRTGRFRMYGAYSVQADVMYRYARRWASGLGVDLFYGSYANHVGEVEKKLYPTDQQQTTSPWSVGVALKHNVYYGNLSVRMSLGYYLYRHMGTNAKEIEQPYYERIGLHYSFPKLSGLTIGACVKAHRTKADLTEVLITLPLKVR